jgi:hypothetical protein
LARMNHPAPVLTHEKWNCSPSQHPKMLAVTTRMNNGSEKTSKAGDVVNIPPGHDAWVVGNEPVVFVDFQGMVDYAKQSK